MEESIRMAEDTDKWKKYVHGVGSRTAKDQLSLALCDKSQWPRLCLSRQPLRYAASGIGFAPLLGYRVASFALFAFSRLDALPASGGWTDRHRAICVY